jgi:hypothetical protein
MQVINTTVVVVVGPGEQLALEAMRAPNVRVLSLASDAGPLERAQQACQEARRTATPYCVHDADPSGLVAETWANRFEGDAVHGDLEVAVTATLARWRAGSLQLPDYYLLLDPETMRATLRHWYLGVLASFAPSRVAVASPSTAVVNQLAQLPAGRWWPALDTVLSGVENLVPDQAGGPDTAPPAPSLFEAGP